MSDKSLMRDMAEDFDRRIAGMQKEIEVLKRRNTELENGESLKEFESDANKVAIMRQDEMEDARKRTGEALQEVNALKAQVRCDTSEKESLNQSINVITAENVQLESEVNKLRCLIKGSRSTAIQEVHEHEMENARAKLVKVTRERDELAALIREMDPGQPQAATVQDEATLALADMLKPTVELLEGIKGELLYHPAEGLGKQFLDKIRAELARLKSITK